MYGLDIGLPYLAEPKSAVGVLWEQERLQPDNFKTMWLLQVAREELFVKMCVGVEMIQIILTEIIWKSVYHRKH